MEIIRSFDAACEFSVISERNKEESRDESVKETIMIAGTRRISSVHAFLTASQWQVLSSWIPQSPPAVGQRRRFGHGGGRYKPVTRE